MFYPGERAGEILRFYRDWVQDCPDELTTLVSLATAPPAPFMPEEWHGKPIVIIPGVYAGSVEDGEQAVRPLRELGEPIADLMGPMPYVAMQSLLDPLWGRRRPQLLQGRLAARPRRPGDRDARALPPRTSARRSREIHVHHIGGAVARVPAGATAFGDRSAPFLLNIIASTFTRRRLRRGRAVGAATSTRRSSRR